MSKILLYIIHFNFFFLFFWDQFILYRLPKKNYNTTVQIITSMLFFFFMINFLLNKLIPVPLPFSCTPKKKKKKGIHHTTIPDLVLRKTTSLIVFQKFLLPLILISFFGLLDQWASIISCHFTLIPETTLTINLP